MQVRYSFACPRLALPSLPWERHTSRCHLPQLLATLTAVAARDLFAVVLGGTGTTGAMFEAIEMVVCGALSVGRVAEPSVAIWRLVGAKNCELACAAVRDPCDSGRVLGRLGLV